jgi:hypothetical protein
MNGKLLAGRLLSLLAVGAAMLWGQATQVSQIAGVVQDATGAAVPSAQVTITNTDTGISRAVASEIDGTYTIPSLPPGPYRLEASKQGFASYTQSGIVLQVNTNPHINIILKVGAVSESVEVQADAVAVETHTNAIGQVVDQQRVVDLPLNGRQVTDLVGLSGGATNLNSIISSNGGSGGASLNIVSNKNYPTSVAVSVAGGQGSQTLFILDGGSNMDLVSNVGLPMPFPDALQEFKMETSSLPANYGSQPGGVVNVITRSGGNNFHGSVFEFLRNYAFNARNFFAPTRDSLKRNQFGGTIGGPIIKNKLFFFAGYQGTYEKISPAANIAHVATAAVLQGDFTAFASPACNAGSQKNFSAPFVGNKVAVSALNPVALNVMKLIPVSTEQCGLLTYGIPGQDHENQAVTRVDWQVNPKHSVFARYFFTDYQHPPVYDGSNLLTMSTDASAGLSDRVQTAVLGHTFIINGTTISSFHAGFSRSAILRYTPDGIPTFTTLGSKVTQGVPSFFSMPVTNYFTPVCTNCSPGPWAATEYQISEEVSMMRGPHQLIFGFNIANLRLNAQGNFQKNGQFTFNGQITGNAMADLMLGKPSQFAQTNGQLGDERLTVPSLYIQDNYRLSSRLTINAGVRWDPFVSPHKVIPQVSIFDPGWYAQGVQSKVFVNAPPGVQFVGDSLMPGSHYFNGRPAEFAPRIGLVYDPRGTGRESIRAGYGLFYGSTPLFLSPAAHAPFAYPVTIPTPTGGFSDPYNGSTYGTNPFPLPNPLPSNVTFPLFGTGLGNYKLNEKPTYMEQWNIAFQKQFQGNWLVSASYLGNRTVHLEFPEYYNPAVYIPGNCTAGQYGLTAAGACSTAGNINYRRIMYLADPNKAKLYGALNVFGDGGNASYNGLLLSAQHPFSHNFTILANYTWSHCLTDADIGLNGAGASQSPFNRQAEHANCLVDRRQVFNISGVVRSPKFSMRALQLIAGNWQESTIFTKATGSWSTVTVGVDNSLTGMSDRPNLMGDASVASPSPAKWFNTAAFVNAPIGSYGSLGRSTILGPGQWNADLSLSRSFKFGEVRHLDFRAEAFNVLNHTRFGNPVTAKNSPSFGQILAAGAPRIMQFALKYTF